MIKLLALLMKRPSDKNIQLIKIILGIIIISIGIIAFSLQGLTLEDSIFGITLTDTTKLILQYCIIGLGVPLVILGGLDVHLLSRGRTRILQIVFGLLLLIIAGSFKNTPSLTIDILYFFIGLGVALAGITGKMITTKGLKYGQKITKIRV